jgi:hypothetical protein
LIVARHLLFLGEEIKNGILAARLQVLLKNWGLFKLSKWPGANGYTLALRELHLIFGSTAFTMVTVTARVVAGDAVVVDAALDVDVVEDLVALAAVVASVKIKGIYVIE